MTAPCCQANADRRHAALGADDRYRGQLSRGDFRLPRTRWSHMSDAEFLKYTEFESASVELVAEMRARFAARVG